MIIPLAIYACMRDCGLLQLLLPLFISPVRKMLLMNITLYIVQLTSGDRRRAIIFMHVTCQPVKWTWRFLQPTSKRHRPINAYSSINSTFLYKNAQLSIILKVALSLCKPNGSKLTLNKITFEFFFIRSSWSLWCEWRNE